MRWREKDEAMRFQDLKKEFDAIKPEHLAKTKEDQVYRYWLLKLLFEINGNVDSLAFCYRKMLEIQKKKNKR